MPKIPLYQFTPQETPAANVRANPGMFDAQNAAAIRLGNAAQNVGDMATSYALRIQQADNYRKKSELDLAMQEEWKAFEATITPASDPVKLVPEWEKRLNAVVAKHAKDVAPAMKGEVADLTGRFRVQTTAQVGGLAKTMVVDRAKKAGAARLDAAWDAGDVKQAETIMQEMAATGLIYPEDIPAMREKGAQRVEYQEAFALINAAPAKAIESLEETTDGGRPKNFKRLDASQRYALMQSARGALNSLRADTQNDFAERRFAGEIIPENELQLAVERGAVSAKWAEAFRKQQLKDAGGAKGDATRFAEVLTAINAYDPVQDGGRARYAELFAQAQLLGTQMATDAIARLKDKADPAGVLNTPVAKDGMKLVEEAFDRGLYGTFEKFEGYGNERKKVVDAKIYAAAVEAKARNQDALAGFLKEKPNATREEVAKFVAGLHAEDVARQGAKLFADPVQRTLALPAPDEVDAILKRHGYPLPNSSKR